MGSSLLSLSSGKGRPVASTEHLALTHDEPYQSPPTAINRARHTKEEKNCCATRRECTAICQTQERTKWSSNHLAHPQDLYEVYSRRGGGTSADWANWL